MVATDFQRASSLGNALQASDVFECFGGTCGGWVVGHSDVGSPAEAVVAVRRCLLRWHTRFSRFDPASELSRLNADPRETVPVSALMARFVSAALEQAARTGGLLDPTLLDEVERAGYTDDHRTSLDIAIALREAPPRHPGAPDPRERWRQVIVDPVAYTVTRPPGLRLDSGGVVKGMCADLMGSVLARSRAYAVDCCGDLRIGGCAGAPRPVQVSSPFDGRILHELAVRDGGVATSGISRRSWRDSQGRPRPSPARPVHRAARLQRPRAGHRAQRRRRSRPRPTPRPRCSAAPAARTTGCDTAACSCTTAGGSRWSRRASPTPPARADQRRSGDGERPRPGDQPDDLPACAASIAPCSDAA